MELNEFEKAQDAYNEMQFENFERGFIKSVCDLILKNKDEIQKIYNIEEKYGNICESIESILNHIKENMKKYNQNSHKSIQRKNSDNFIVGKYQESLGVLGVIYDGNPYITIELALKAISTKNAIIFCTNNQRYAITNLIVLYFKQILKEYGYSMELIQAINSDDYEEMFNHNTILSRLIVIGNKNLQNKCQSKSKIEVITSGYNCYDLYIENIMDEQLIKKILNVKDIELNIYINKNIASKQIELLGIDEYTEVDSAEECIRDININSAGYCSSIFSNSGEVANKFLKLVKTKNVFVNASPTVERSLDIDENDLLYTKGVMFSNS